MTSDQITTPFLSIRNVPRRGAPVASLKTPYARAAAPCCQKSDANANVAPSSRFQAWRAAEVSHETKITSVSALSNEAEVGLEVDRFLGADRRERERVEDEQDVALAAIVLETEPRGIERLLEVELRCLLTRLRSPLPLSSPLPEGT